MRAPMMALLLLASSARAGDSGIHMEAMTGKVNLGEYIATTVDTVRDDRGRIRFLKREELFEQDCYEECRYTFLTAVMGPDLPYEFTTYEIHGAEQIRVIGEGNHQTWRDYGFECGWRRHAFTLLEITDYQGAKREFALLLLDSPDADTTDLHYNAVRLRLLEKRTKNLSDNDIPQGCIVDLVG